VVPQGGNTGLSGGATPDESGRAIVISLARLNRIRAVDTLTNTLTAEAGSVLQRVQAVAAQNERLFPLSLAAEGSCTIGGNLATNAGGTAVLRYGSARELCLGIEGVTAQGDIWDGLSGLRKDNAGYDLRDRQSAVNVVVHDLAVRHGGSIAAEHGLGVLRRDEALRYRAPVATAMMRAVKQALDPQWLLNPGKVLA
jgi:FAD/FMN-containing dehydrogenase